jgi:hypothetical protein
MAEFGSRKVCPARDLALFPSQRAQLSKPGAHVALAAKTSRRHTCLDRSKAIICVLRINLPGLQVEHLGQFLRIAMGERLLRALTPMLRVCRSAWARLTNAELRVWFVGEKAQKILAH